MWQSKEAYIRTIKNGTLNYYTAIHENIAVSIDNKDAWLTGQSLVTAAVFGGGQSTWRLRLEIRLKKRLLAYDKSSCFHLLKKELL